MYLSQIKKVLSLFEAFLQFECVGKFANYFESKSQAPRPINDKNLHTTVHEHKKSSN